jgi:hypothetical protein
MHTSRFENEGKAGFDKRIKTVSSPRFQEKIATLTRCAAITLKGDKTNWDNTYKILFGVATGSYEPRPIYAAPLLAEKSGE